MSEEPQAATLAQSAPNLPPRAPIYAAKPDGRQTKHASASSKAPARNYKRASVARHFLKGVAFLLVLVCGRALAQLPPGQGNVTVSGNPVTGHCAQFAGSTVISDAGGVCGAALLAANNTWTGQNTFSSTADTYEITVTVPGGGTTGLAGILLQPGSTSSAGGFETDAYTSSITGNGAFAWSYNDKDVSSNSVDLGFAATVLGSAGVHTFVLVDYSPTYDFVIATNGAASANMFTFGHAGTFSAPAYSAGATAGVSCAAASVNLTTFTVTNGIVTHC